ncbi:MAG TPA: DUF1697 domain-containing protein, partial [Gaiellaceae bacterium]|nr:DUF1697 domain-containing protein [Gaiellaceae bacterium]
MSSAKTFVALLRGVNLAGRNRVSMPELRSALEAMGLEDVVTYIQSGNVVFRSRTGDAKTLAAAIEAQVAEAFGIEVIVLLRTPAEVARVAAGNPFLRGGADPARLHVLFLSGKPSAKAVAQLDPERSPPDEFKVVGREIYLHTPNGFGRSKLTVDYFERRLGVAGTARNWKTV